MKPINVLLTLLSLNAVLVIIERVSPTTNIILQPYNFLRVHEVFQMTIVITISIVLSFFLLKVLSNNFALLKTKQGIWYGILFVLGVYFTATGNGLHEMASYLFNTFCNTKAIESRVCASTFFNDYYFGNIVYFIGLLLGNISLILFEKMNPNKTFTKNDTRITLINGFVYALAMFAYAAFDRVIVGLVFTTIAAISIDYLLLTSKTKITTLPFTLYCAFAYSLATVASAIVRFH